MCLYPILIKNKKYEPNKKNGGNPPTPTDSRVRLVPVKCGKCMECRKAISREWQIRLQEEIKHDNKAQFITLTFNDEELCKLIMDISKKEEASAREIDGNWIATEATRRFLERWRKSKKKSVKHWLVSEMGHKNTERIHLHGLIWTSLSAKEIQTIWKYGKIWIGEYVNAKTINYIVKYITKLDNDHKGFQGKVLCSPGIGKGYTQTFNAKQNEYNEKQTNETYKLNNGAKVALPVYFRNKIYSEEERQKLWLEKLDKQTRYVNGQKIRIRNRKDELTYFKILEYEQRKNKLLGYGDRTWNKKVYAASKKLLENLED